MRSEREDMAIIGIEVISPGDVIVSVNGIDVAKDGAQKVSQIQHLPEEVASERSSIA